MSRLISFLLSALAGVLLFLAFPPADQGFFVWVGLVPLFAVLWRGPRPSGWKDHAKNAFCGYVCGLFFYGLSFWWINEVSTLGYIPFTLYLSLFPAAWAWLAGGPLRPERTPYEPSGNAPVKTQVALWSYKDMGRTLLAANFCACAWVVIEWLRGYGQISFGWNPLGVALDPVLAQTAEWIGAVGLSFFPVLVSAILWSSGSRVVATISRSGKRTAQWDFLAAMSMILLLFLWGTWRSARINADSAKQTGKDNVPLRVLLVQENTPQFIPWPQERRQAHLQTYLSDTKNAIQELQKKSLEESMKTGQPARLRKPDWIIWPESAMTWPLYQIENRPLPREQPLLSFHANSWVPFSREEGPFTLFAGVDEFFYSPDNLGKPSRLYNTVRYFTDDFDKGSRAYRKKHLVPFGEYIPLRESLPILEKAFAFSAGISMGSNFQAGTSTKPLKVQAGRETISVIPSICFEDTLPGLTRSFIDTESPQVILNITNDGWFNKSWAAEQHFRNARLRAIELRRPLIRAANTGVTSVIGEDGRTFSPKYGEEGIRELRDAEGKTFHKGYLYATLDLPRSPVWTLYARLGDWFVLQCSLLVLFALIRPYLRRTQRGPVRDGVYIPSHKREKEEEK